MCIYSVYIRALFFFFKQKTAYEMRISDWSSDVCSSDLQILSDLSCDGDRSRARHLKRPGTIYRLRHLNSRTETPSPQGCAVSYRRGEELRAEAMRCVQRALWENYRQHKRAHPGELRSEERRVGKEGVRTWESRGAPS